MLIAQMDDSHLLNTILLFLRSSEKNSIGLSEENAAFLGIPSPSKREIGEAKDLVLKKIHDYLIEAVMRGLDVTSLLQSYLGRNEAISKDLVFSLPSSSVELLSCPYEEDEFFCEPNF